MPPLRQIPDSIKSLSDQELADQLLAHNVSVGPILPSTRRVYEIKLCELQTGEKPAPASPYAPVEEDDDDNGKGSNEGSFRQQARHRTTLSEHEDEDGSTRRIPSSVGQPLPRRPLHPETEGTYTPSAAAKKKSAEKQSGGLPVWVKIISVIIIAVIVYLVIKNMEADPASSIPTVEI